MLNMGDAQLSLSMKMIPAQLSIAFAPLSLSFGMPGASFIGPQGFMIHPGVSVSDFSKHSHSSRSSGRGSTSSLGSEGTTTSNNGAIHDHTPSTEATESNNIATSSAALVASTVVGAGVVVSAIVGVAAMRNNLNKGLQRGSSSVSIATTQPGDIV